MVRQLHSPSNNVLAKSIILMSSFPIKSRSLAKRAQGLIFITNSLGAPQLFSPNDDVVNLYGIEGSRLIVTLYYPTNLYKATKRIFTNPSIKRPANFTTYERLGPLCDLGGRRRERLHFSNVSIVGWEVPRGCGGSSYAASDVFFDNAPKRNQHRHRLLLGF